ncbi:hypothetical protein SPRG_10151 [Saprolegnia parasitica CBS 223.65]|uniref:Major facilitator superfamily (MFS) profile domain-containing protein n=1 Tax=Saprolegnia parasitica (strain CBS 223.65) TaxID=695850 RepID=A0A067C1H2_SAPPC|nr:hypothetical protein SPRG_10151 [Saprolegnia parasitica CBS 223.65]KDO24619.1 hypothetical protein SPRG_10151 [Saprolegnia parasitica CBS 223.65]|eukprot:XP_012204687.1 hypothetical protein SPRG_10151 [Saprolegnia parasitica CBS 223.65]
MAAYDLVADAQPSVPRRSVGWALVALAVAANLLFGGFIYGWASILLFLQGERQYASLCATDSAIDSVTHTCVAQDNRLNVIFGVAQVTFTISSLPIGMLLDRFGPTILAACGGVASTLGLLLFAISDASGFDAFLPAYVLTALGGMATLLVGFQTGFVLPGWQTAILASINCAFDASAVLPTVLYAIYDASGASRRTLLIIYACLAAATYSLWTFLWWTHHRSVLMAVAEEQDADDVDDDETVQVEPEAASLVAAPLAFQLRTFEFRYLLLFTSVHSFHNAFYFGSINRTLAKYDDVTRVYTKVFGWVLPVGFIYIPLINVVIERHGLGVSMLMTTILCMMTYGIAFAPSLPPQVVAFVLFTGFRGFFYASNSAFAAHIFGPAHMGTIIGITYAISGLVALLEVPAASLATSSDDGWYAMYGTALGLCVFLLPCTEVYRRHATATQR